MIHGRQRECVLVVQFVNTYTTKRRILPVARPCYSVVTTTTLRCFNNCSPYITLNGVHGCDDARCPPTSWPTPLSSPSPSPLPSSPAAASRRGARFAACVCANSEAASHGGARNLQRGTTQQHATKTTNMGAGHRLLLATAAASLAAATEQVQCVDYPSCPRVLLYSLPVAAVAVLLPGCRSTPPSNARGGVIPIVSHMRDCCCCQVTGCDHSPTAPLSSRLHSAPRKSPRSQPAVPTPPAPHAAGAGERG